MMTKITCTICLIGGGPGRGRSSTAYSASGRLSSVTGNLSDGATRTYANQFEYNAAGQMTKECFGTTTSLFHSLKYNNRFQLAEVYLGTSTNSWNRGALSFYYGNAMRASGNPYANGLDNNGNVTQVEHWVPLNDAITQSVIYRDKYEYDMLNRIQQVKGYFVNTSAVMSQIYQQTYTIDAWGNRKIDANAAQTWGGVNNAVFTVPTVNGVPTNNRLNEVSYDLAGNTTTDITAGGSGSLTFDGANRMTRAITVPSPAIMFMTLAGNACAALSAASRHGKCLASRVSCWRNIRWRAERLRLIRSVNTSIAAATCSS